MTQTKLTKEQISNCRNIASLLDNGALAFGWWNTEEGSDYWMEVVTKLREKIHHGTSDGKPYVEPEPPIPEGWRKATADEWKRKDVKHWDNFFKEWRPRMNQGTAFDPSYCGTRYIVPIDLPLTDEDACVCPRLLVMVRDDESKPWRGPVEFHGICPGSGFPFSYMGISDKLRGIAVYARRATREEIEAANGNS